MIRAITANIALSLDSRKRYERLSRRRLNGKSPSRSKPVGDAQRAAGDQPRQRHLLHQRRAGRGAGQGRVLLARHLLGADRRGARFAYRRPIPAAHHHPGRASPSAGAPAVASALYP